MEKESNTKYESWCVEITDENREIIGKWFNENGTTGYDCYHKDIYVDYRYKYLGFPARLASHYFSEKEVKENGYTIISFEEFKRDILEINEIPEKWAIKNVDEDLIEPLRKLYEQSGYYEPSKVSIENIYVHYPILGFERGTFYDIQKGYTEINSNTLRKILKMEKNSKQILGYKIKENCKQYESAVKVVLSTASLYDWWDKNAKNNFNRLGYNFQTSADYHSVERILRRANILEAWFEPVYASEYKVGDWVVVKSGRQSDGNGVSTDNYVCELLENEDVTGIYTSGRLIGDSDFHVQIENGQHRRIKVQDIIRKATEEEIKESKLVVLTIGTSDIRVIVSKGKIIAEGKEVSAESLSTLVHDMNGSKQYNLPWNVGFGSSVVIGCSSFKQGELNQVLEEYDVINNTSFALLPF